MTRFIYLSSKGTAAQFVDQLNTYIIAGYTTLLGNLSISPGQPQLREVLLENTNHPIETGVSLVTNY